MPNRLCGAPKPVMRTDRKPASCSILRLTARGWCRRVAADDAHGVEEGQPISIEQTRNAIGRLRAEQK
jgi:hypothetical protein